MRSFLLRAFLNHFPGFVVGVSFTLILLSAQAAYLGGEWRVGSNEIMVQPEGVTNYRPIKALDDGWYLVEVQQRYSCENPLPIGHEEMHVIVPHLVRMRASELDNPEIER